MSNDEPRPERRRDHRVSPKGTVTVRCDSYVLAGRLANLSRAGLLCRTRVTAPTRLLGARAEIALRLDGGEASWLPLRGRILRIGAGSLAVVFDLVPPAFARFIDEATSGSRDHARSVSVVLVDGTAARRDALADGFRAAGCAVITVATPLEAIVRLGESDFEPDLIAIADSLPATISDELRRFVTAEHPRAMLVTLDDATTAASIDDVLATYVRR